MAFEESIQKNTSDEIPSFRHKLLTNRIGLWLFLVSDTFLFGGLMIYVALWGNTRPELNQYLGLVVTFILLVSSFFVYRE
jgi:cytochrome c oxidase subunit 3